MTTHYDQEETTYSANFAPRPRPRQPLAYSEYDHDDGYDLRADLRAPSYGPAWGPERSAPTPQKWSSIPKGAIIAGLLGAVGVGAGLGLFMQSNSSSAPTQPAVLMVPENNTAAPAALPPAQAVPAPAPAPAAGPGVIYVPRDRSVTTVVVPPPAAGKSSNTPAAVPAPPRPGARSATGAATHPQWTDDRAPAAAEPVSAAPASRTGRRLGPGSGARSGSGSGSGARSGRRLGSGPGSGSEWWRFGTCAEWRQPHPQPAAA